MPIFKRSSAADTAIALLLFTLLAGCGGGGGGGESAPATTATPPSEMQGAVEDGMEPGSQTPPASDETAGDDIVSENNDTQDIEIPVPVEPSSTATIVIGAGRPAPDAQGRTLQSLDRQSIRINRSGQMAARGRFGLGDRFALWGGSVFQPTLLLEPGDSVAGFATNVRASTVDSFSIGRSDDVAAVISLEGASEEKAVVQFTGSQATVVARSDAETMVDGTALQLDRFDSVRRDGDSVAYVGYVHEERTPDRQYRGLFLSQDDTTSLVSIELGSSASRLLPTQQDGCRLLLRLQQPTGPSGATYSLAVDGSVLFEAAVVVETGALSNPAICPARFAVVTDSGTGPVESAGGFNRASFNAIVRYQNDTGYARVVSVGDPVPGMVETVFSDVQLLRSLSDGSAVVAATVKPIVERTGVSSLWVFGPSGDARLIALEGETVDSSAGAATTVLDRRFDDLQIADDLSVALLHRTTTDPRTTQSWLLSGMPHAGQPHTSLAAVGASALLPLVFSGGPAPEGFADSTFFDGVGRAAILDGGAGFFAGEVGDATNDGSSAVSGIWRFDSNGSVSPLLLNGELLSIDEIPRVIEGLPSSDTVSRSLFPVGTDGLVFLESVNSSRGQVIYLPLSN